MEDSIDRMSRKLAAASSRREFVGIFLGSILAVAQQPACPSLTAPTRVRTGYEQCGETGQLYCNSALVPRTLAQNVPGTCCFNAVNRNASVGFLCAFGSDRGVIGCYNDIGEARSACGSFATIVRCTAG